LKDGFHHVRMAEDSIKYTAFVTPFGQYEYLKMPFGLKNAPARFQRFVNEVLSDEIKSGNVIVYMGDNIMKLKSRLEREQDGLFEMRSGLVCQKKGDKLLFYVSCAMKQEINV